MGYLNTTAWSEYNKYVYAVRTANMKRVMMKDEVKSDHCKKKYDIITIKMKYPTQHYIYYKQIEFCGLFECKQKTDARVRTK